MLGLKLNHVSKRGARDMSFNPCKSVGCNTQPYSSNAVKLMWLFSFPLHFCDAIMSAMASPITSLAIVYSAVHSDADKRNHQSYVSLAFVRGTHRWPVNSPYKGTVTRKMFPFDDVIMCGYYSVSLYMLYSKIGEVHLWPTFLPPKRRFYHTLNLDHKFRCDMLLYPALFY